MLFLIDASLCGIHALNNLLQGPYFGVESLSEIAAELDRREKDLMAEMGTDTEEYKKFAKVRRRREKKEGGREEREEEKRRRKRKRGIFCAFRRSYQ